MAAKNPPGNPHKTRRATVAPVRGKQTGRAVGQSIPGKFPGQSNEPHGTTDRKSYDYPPSPQ